MTQQQFDPTTLLDALRESPDFDLVREMVRFLYQALIDVESTEQIGADPHQRTRNSQDLWMSFPADYAATSSSSSSARSAITPFSKTTPARTSATRWGALTIRHRVWACSISL